MSRRALVLLAVCAGACREGSAPPSGSQSSAAKSVGPAPSGAPSAPVGQPATEPAAPRPSEPVGVDAGRPAAVGGNWLKCYASFQPRNQPDLDVLRLGLMCGPSNGMHKLTEARVAELPDAGGREHRWKALAGDCFRIFAVGDPGIEDLDVEVLDPKGARIAFDTGDDRWPVVKPDGPFCAFSDGEYRALVRAQRGTGKYAVEIWRMR